MATIYDVAKKAGVSPKTVSRVLNGDAPVKAGTRDAVNAAIDELAYVPSHAARSMRSQKSGLVGMITGAISASPKVSEPAGIPSILIVQGAQRVLAEHGKTLLISDTGGQNERIPELVQTFLEHRVEGLIYTAEYHQKVQLPARLKGKCVVLANCFDDLGTPAILPDDEGGEYALVRGLLERGHRRIGFLTPPENQIARELRLEGYRHALGEYGVSFDPALVSTAALSDQTHEFDLLWDALNRVLNTPNPPTAICCGNDKMALRLYTMLRERGLRIPEDISVAGYDNYQIITEHLHPKLTSVDLPNSAIGARAAEKLLHMIADTQGQHEPTAELVSGPVAWRQSTAVVDPKVTAIDSKRRNQP